MVSPPRMKSHFCLAALTGYASALPTPFKGDAIAVEFLAAGGDGCISVVSNLVPASCVELHSAWTCGNDAGARGIARTLAPLTAALFMESNPIPVKLALNLLGFMGAELRFFMGSLGHNARRRYRGTEAA
jgi:4-hydroxy-tetrahydrodipicolinate synthase